MSTVNNTGKTGIESAGTEESAGVGDLIELLDAQVRTRPDAVAVGHGNDTLTFRELTEAARYLALHLRTLGVGKDTCVGLFTSPGLQQAVGVWGILRSGGAYLPLSPEYPDERIRTMIEDSGITVVHTEEKLLDRARELAGTGVRIVTERNVEEFRKSLDENMQSIPLPQPGPEDLAYVIYTSGSTGRPKGVMIEHRAIAHQMTWLKSAYGLGPDKVVLQKTPLSFDAAQWEFLAPACGARTVMAPAGSHRDPGRIIDEIAVHSVTTLQCVPTLLAALLDHQDMSRCTSLQQIFSGGESLSRKLALHCTRTLPHCTLVNLYGPTECTINTSAHTVDPAVLAPEDGPRSVPIGRPVPGLRYHVLDDRGRPAGPGETGELHISGVQLARGYLHRPDLTAEHFVPSPHPAPHDRLYRTGDLAHWNADGTVQFTGRADNQVKLRGHRIELDEIRLAIEAHDWVKNAAVLVRDDPRTGFQNLVACLELSPREAALMDQGTFGDHHISKDSRLQVRAQLSTAGVRDDLAEARAVDLPGAEATPEQRRRAFARKTYRFYEGGAPTEQDILAALSRVVPSAPPRRPEQLTLTELGAILRDFGPHTSAERLLPKYAYASPGSLYATQLYAEITGCLPGLAPGLYYYHPLRHQLVLVRPAHATDAAPGITFHFVGRRSAIEPVYKTNIQEVLEIETGHMLGLFDEILPVYGLGLRTLPHDPRVCDRCGCADDDPCLGSYALTSADPGTRPEWRDRVDVHVQIHPGSGTGLRSGQYRHRAGRLERIADELVLRRHVIAINQQVYQRASLGITLTVHTPGDEPEYVNLGRALQYLQHNTAGLGFMPAGYSSRSGRDLPAARRMTTLLEGLGLPTGPLYFCVGGRISDDQIAHEGMYEDTVHMKGPAELVKDDLAARLPEFMVPNQILILERLPHTANGKLDVQDLTELADTAVARGVRPVVPPRNRTEARLCELWKAALHRDVISVRDDFFACGGNSLIAVSLVHRVNREFGCSLPLQVLFTAPTVEQLAERIAADTAPPPRLVPLSRDHRAAHPRPDGTSDRPVLCWPGLGGYAMNLRLLASRLAEGPDSHTLYGIQAYGLNEGEIPHDSLEEMAAADVRALRRVQPEGPYTLWGYSFGARVAFTAARRLEHSGEEVDRLVLLAPGSPRLPGPPSWTAAGADFGDRTFRTILYSVFAGRTDGPLLDACLREGTDEESFARFVLRHFPDLGPTTVRRVIRVACRTYGWEPAPGPVTAPVTVLVAHGDEESFIERDPAFAAGASTVVRLDTTHYGLLRDPGVDELAHVIRHSII
ncbi:amino acid adenylation protein [Streptomyces sp. NWU339]|uniref:amino acid adenylation domain-containing protein n=1 Tax=Streptomyces sp. NWU339 TaxID=2185284 RepID=UPI000D67E96E|nr:amino acid adenylation domain-containing protein [Streptomyces sp. NWU339]PWI08957.1 amino acid adenylation protein [Streptomyces sp. NWU339]